MTTAGDIDIETVIDERPVSAFQKWILILVGFAIVMDGFDVQAMGFVAPAIIRAWGIDRAALGPVFGASLFGMLIGSLGFSVLADRVGRRTVLISTTMFFSICMFATAFAQSLPQLLALRFITGLGLGGVMANAVALAGEYSPRRRRASIMMWVSCGFTGGAVLGGVISAVLIPLGGWQAVFIFGGAIPFVISILMMKFIPESMQFLVLAGRGTERIGPWLRNIAPDLVVDANTRFVVHEDRHQGAPVAALFRSGRAVVTLLLWGINFMNLLNLFFLANWLPTIAVDAGHTAETAVLVGTTLQLGGVVGTLIMGPLIDRLGFYRVLIPTFLVAVLSIAAIGQQSLPIAMLLVTVAVSGYCIVGSQPALNALAAIIYPTSMRATGMGWSLGIGRAGSIVGPVVAGQLIALHWSSGSLFLAAAVPALLSCAMLTWLSRLRAAATDRPAKNVEMAPLSPT